MNDLPRRRNSLRYPGYDYSQPGALFVTLVTHNRQLLFGSACDSGIVNTFAGDQLASRWQSIPEQFPSVEIDEFVVMPDHMHGILWFGIRDDPAPPTCSQVISWLKTMFQQDYAFGVREQDWPRYDGHLWQRGYYDHIIRGSRDLDAVRAYISDNPRRWLEKCQ